jgi:uncharacterized protein YecE (DUF72 family)
MSDVKIGTCSWKYDSWQGLIYSKESKANYLADYARHFDTVEIDQWFWSLFDKIALPRPQVVEEYAASVPDFFKFSIKIPNSVTLTHFYRKNKNEPLKVNPHFLSIDLFERFLQAIEPLQPNLGPLMFQFEYLNKQKMPSQIEFQKRFLDFIQRCPTGYSYAVEIRNPNYLNPAYFQFLQQNDLSHVFLQGYYMPSIFPLYEKFKELIQGTSIIRLHGPDRKGIEKKSSAVWNRILEPKEDDLEQLTRMVNDLWSREIQVYLNVNNHYEGSAPLTIDRIRERLSFL